jgi:hypothetical protein
MNVTETHREHHESAIQPHELLCPVCEAAVLTYRHCRNICEVCGYVESCEDNFVRPPSGSVQYVDAHG